MLSWNGRPATTTTARISILYALFSFCQWIFCCHATPFTSAAPTNNSELAWWVEPNYLNSSILPAGELNCTVHTVMEPDLDWSSIPLRTHLHTAIIKIIVYQSIHINLTYFFNPLYFRWRPTSLLWVVESSRNFQKCAVSVCGGLEKMLSVVLFLEQTCRQLMGSLRAH